MYATVRQYTGIAPNTFDQMEQLRPGIEALVQSVPGFVAYDMLKTDGGMTTVTVCENQAGAEDSNHRVAAWVKENAATLLPNPPRIMAGESVIHVTAG